VWGCGGKGVGQGTCRKGGVTSLSLKEQVIDRCCSRCQPPFSATRCVSRSLHCTTNWETDEQMLLTLPTTLRRRVAGGVGEPLLQLMAAP
jgi:hypothetical protein